MNADEAVAPLTVVEGSSPILVHVDDNDVDDDGVMVEEESNANSTHSNHQRRRRPRYGNCARRRTLKARAITNAIAAAASSNGTSSAVPSDRDRVLDGVIVRRREERNKRESRTMTTVGGGVVDLGNGGDINGDNDGNERSGSNDDGGRLDAEDERALLSQLGFVPGNVICVAARLSTNLQEALVLLSAARQQRQQQQQHQHDGSSSSSSSSCNSEIINKTKKAGTALTPAVVKLYPLAARDPYKGGRSDGRAFKGRRRGVATKQKKNNSWGSIDENKYNEGGGDDDDDDDDDDDKVSGINSNTTNADDNNENAITSITAADIDNVKQEQSTTPSNATSAAKAAKNQIIIEPFPTLYWLTSPLLRAQISKLEESKYYNVSVMESKLHSSSEYMSQMARAHASYGQSRWDTLLPCDQVMANEYGWKCALDASSRGVAGIRKYGSVKCLHAHVAHYLAQISEWEEEEERQHQREMVVGTVMRRECLRDDLNLVGKWTMENLMQQLLVGEGGETIRINLMI